jgi:DegV family protein with EDD domain
VETKLLAESGGFKVKKIAIVTDSNSGISQQLAGELGISVVPMPFTINGEVYHEGVSLSTEQFFELQEGGADISTSQPSLPEVTELWDRLLEEYEEIVHIPMSSALSSSCSTAMMLAQDYEGKVYVVDNQRISITQKRAVFDAVEMAQKGYEAAKIKEILEETKLDSSIYITLETLKYLKKGGRITPAAAAIGTLLKIKPVLQIQGGKLDAFAKARTKKQAKKIMLDAIMKDMKTRFGSDESGKGIYIFMAYTGDDKEINEYKAEVQELFPEHEIICDHLSLSVSCHIGMGAIAIACVKKLDI